MLRAVRSAPPDDLQVADLARGFQDAAIDVLAAKTVRASEELGYGTVMIGGGVACNRALVAAVRERVAGEVRVSVASPRLNTDNAAMIAAAGAWRLARGEQSDLNLEPRTISAARPHHPFTSRRTRVMPIYPLVFHLGPLEITGYGIMMMVAFLMGGWLIALELRRRQLAEDYAADLVAAAVVGGIIGAKYGTSRPPEIQARSSRAGDSYGTGDSSVGRPPSISTGGGFASPSWTMQLVAPALAAAYALGRVGMPSSTMITGPRRVSRGRSNSRAGCLHPPPATWNILARLPPGTDPATVLAVHPTQLYETGIMLVVFAVSGDSAQVGRWAGCSASVSFSPGRNGSS